MSTLKPVFMESIDDELSGRIADAFAAQIARCVLEAQKLPNTERDKAMREEKAETEKQCDIAAERPKRHMLSGEVEPNSLKMSFSATCAAKMTHLSP